LNDIATGQLASVVKDAERLAGLRGIAGSMGETPPDPAAPVREIPARLGDRWSTLILLVLQTGSYRHAELKRTISVLSYEKSISQRMLTLRLRMLERNGLVERKVTPTIPPRVDYSITQFGDELTTKFFQLVRWIQSNDARIYAARSKFDSQNIT